MQRSSRVGSLAQANALLELPVGKDVGKDACGEGEEVGALMMGEIGSAM